MGQKLEIDKENQAIQLFSNKKQEWEDKTMSISAMFIASYYGNVTGYDIYFKGSDKKFCYKEENVRILHKVRNIDITKQDVYADGVKVNATKLELFEKRFYRVYTGINTIITQHIELKSNKYRDIFTYFTKLAEYAGTIAEKESPLYYLSQNYTRLRNELPESVLIDYLQGECKPNTNKGQLILPFDFNQSQVKAIDAALRNNISVIEGPPGTGKTQTILNLIASIVFAGKNCAVISNNNTAIDNIYEKLDEEHLAFIAASLGRKTNVLEFFENERNEELTGFLKLQIPPLAGVRKRVDELSLRMKKIQDMEVETCVLESQLIEVQNEKRHYDNFSDEAIIINQKLSSGKYLSFIYRLQDRWKIGFFERWILMFKFRIKTASVDVNVLLLNAEKLYYRTRISELSEEIAFIKKFLKDQNKERVGKELKSFYRKLLDNHLGEHYRKLPFQTFSAETYKQDFEKFLLRYPVVLSTSQSLLNNAPKGFIFDYLIIDEASQGDLLNSTLAISCARNLVVVGDSRQLQQINEECLFSQSELLAKEYHVKESYRYASNSILKSVKDGLPNVPVTLLIEHYRCAPDIINFCNKMFYEGELVAMTKNTGKHIEIVKTVPGNHARRIPNGCGMYNQREIDELENILKDSDSKSIGIISPFRYQANLITNKYITGRIEADTIHKFQGRQKDEVILSFVVNSLEKDPNNVENRLYDFVTNDIECCHLQR